MVPHSSCAGSRGGIAFMGATHPLGNTEEALVRKNYGVAERDAGSTVPFNHVTGVGHVDAHVGLYDDCIRRKNTRSSSSYRRSSAASTAVPFASSLGLRT